MLGFEGCLAPRFAFYPRFYNNYIIILPNFLRIIGMVVHGARNLPANIAAKSMPTDRDRKL
jgi:hypothetical protein